MYIDVVALEKLLSSLLKNSKVGSIDAQLLRQEQEDYSVQAGYRSVRPVDTVEPGATTKHSRLK